jgi:hypothetical protein
VTRCLILLKVELIFSLLHVSYVCIRWISLLSKYGWRISGVLTPDLDSAGRNLPGATARPERKNTPLQNEPKQQDLRMHLRPRYSMILGFTYGLVTDICIYIYVYTHVFAFCTYVVMEGVDIDGAHFSRIGGGPSPPRTAWPHQQDRGLSKYIVAIYIYMLFNNFLYGKGAIMLSAYSTCQCVYIYIYTCIEREKPLVVLIS